jgi:hypothetical protein
VKLQLVRFAALPKVWLFVFISSTISLELKAVFRAASSHAFLEEIFNALPVDPFAVKSQFAICHI